MTGSHLTRSRILPWSSGLSCGEDSVDKLTVCMLMCNVLRCSYDVHSGRWFCEHCVDAFAPFLFWVRCFLQWWPWFSAKICYDCYMILSGVIWLCTCDMFQWVINPKSSFPRSAIMLRHLCTSTFVNCYYKFCFALHYILFVCAV